MSINRRIIFLIASNKNHYSYYNTIIHLLNKKGYNCYIFLDSVIYHNISKEIINSNKNNFFVVKLPFFHFKVLLKLIRYRRKCKLLIHEQIYIKIITSTLVILTLKIFKFKIAYIIHNVNSWFLSSINFNVKTKIINLFKYLIIKLSDDLIVLNENMKNYMQNSLLITNRIHVIPFSMALDSSLKTIQAKNDSIIKLVIIGKVDSNKKEYNKYVQIIEKLILKNITNIELCLLGYLNLKTEEALYNEIERINSIAKKQPIKYFTHFVENTHWNNIISQSHFILNNNKMYINNYDGNPEIFGITKESGTFFAGLYYNKPVISNNNYPGITEYSSSTIYYKNDDDLMKYLIQIADYSEFVFKNYYNKLIDECSKNGKIFNKNIMENLKI